jgi:small subunit ribosomal protein S6
MRQYETTFILRPNLGEDQFTEIIDRTCAIITDDGGTIIDTDRWGIKRLAYEIKKEVQGYYVCLNYAAPGKTIGEIERVFRIDDRLLRYLTIKLADTITADGISKEQESFAVRAAAVEEEAAAEEKETTVDTNKAAGTSEKKDSSEKTPPAAKTEQSDEPEETTPVAATEQADEPEEKTTATEKPAAAE